MTFKAWLLTTWGRIRETLQPELFALRRELREARQEFAAADRRCQELQYATQLWRDRADQANKAANNLSERLAQRTRELKAARAKLKAAGK
jgi:chromosome segregation ATPase